MHRFEVETVDNGYVLSDEYGVRKIMSSKDELIKYIETNLEEI